MGDYLGLSWGLVTVHKHTAFLPASRPSNSNTHTHTKNTTVYPQQWTWFCGCEASPQWEEAEETSTAACLLLITSKKLLTSWQLRQRQQKQTAAEVTLFTADDCWTIFLNHTQEKTFDSWKEIFTFIFPEGMRKRLTRSLRLWCSLHSAN